MIRTFAILAALCLAAVSATAGHAQSPGPGKAVGLLGVVAAQGSGSAAKVALKAASQPNMGYYGGPVMHTNTVHAIYWIPSGWNVSTNYRSLVDGYFRNVAAASGTTSNVYYSDTQYYDGSGNLSYRSTFAGSILDTNAFPANGCTDSATSVCLSDAQITAEIQRLIGAYHWQTGLANMYLLFTPRGVGSCAGSICAFTDYCAYHSGFYIGSQVALYANMPYADTVPSACDAGQRPNGDEADATINLISHEHNETITDPYGNAWYDRVGNENGDKCAWNFGASLGGSSGSRYNQVINGAHYFLQQEWSNHRHACVLTGT